MTTSWKKPIEMRRRLRTVFTILMVSGDLMMIGMAYSIAYLIRFKFDLFIGIFPITKGIPPASDFMQASPIILCMWMIGLSWQGCYKRFQVGALDEAVRLFQGAFFGTLLLMAALFFYREETYSRLTLGMAGMLGFGFLYLFREIAKISYLSWVRVNRKLRRVLVVGEGYLATSVKKTLERYRDRSVLTIRGSSLNRIKNTILRSRLEEVLLSKTQLPHEDIVKLADFCEDHGVRFLILPDLLEIRLGEVIIDDFLGIPTMQIKPVSLHGTAFFKKRILDLIAASLLLLLLSIPLTLIALLIKLTSPGPVFYKHERMGYRQRPFQFMKFRTMVKEADDLLEDLKAKNDRVGPAFKIKKDPRITPFGKFLRRYSLDELPQLINVLRGEMSLVGPRPQVLWEAAAYDNWAKKRLNVLPGITGLWQTSGRAELTYQEMIDLDIYYIEHWSIGLDLKILLKTIPVVFFGEGAY